jgi:hypothetical protein
MILNPFLICIGLFSCTSTAFYLHRDRIVRRMTTRNRRLPTCCECSTTSLARNQDQLLKLTAGAAERIEHVIAGSRE